jgi:hypothetical protein
MAHLVGNLHCDRHGRRSHVRRELPIQKTLNQAVTNRFHDAAHLKQDEHLKSLRPHPEFQKLLKELDSKATAQAK